MSWLSNAKKLRLTYISTNKSKDNKMEATMFSGLISTPQPIEVAYHIGAMLGVFATLALDAIAKRIQKYIHFKD